MYNVLMLEGQGICYRGGRIEGNRLSKRFFSGEEISLNEEFDSVNLSTQEFKAAFVVGVFDSIWFAYNQKHGIYIRQGAIEEAEDLFEKASELLFENSDFLENSLRDTDVCDEIFEKAEKLYENYCERFFVLFGEEKLLEMG